MLRHHLTTALLGAALALAPTTLLAQRSLSIAGGASAPVGDLGEVTDLGYNAAIGLNLGGTRLPIGARLEAGYNSFAFKEGDGSYRIITGTANAVVNFSQAADSPYLIGGIGAYNSKASIDNVDTADSRTVVGINIGGGLRFPLGGLSTFLEARYHAGLGERSEGTNNRFIPITFGIMF